MSKVFRYQGYHLLIYVAIGAILYVAILQFPDGDRLIWGLSARELIALSWVFAALHQGWIAFFWRTELYLGKIGATLELLMTLRGQDQIPEEMRDVAQRETASVSINFSHELNASEIQSLEDQGVRFVRLDDEVAHSGTIYGAEVPWDQIEGLAQDKSVVRVESAWQPALPPPAN